MKILSCILDNYEDAVEYRNRQRRLTPPIYNENRVAERPIPRIQQPGLNNIANRENGIENVAEDVETSINDTDMNHEIDQQNSIERSVNDHLDDANSESLPSRTALDFNDAAFVPSLADQQAAGSSHGIINIASGADVSHALFIDESDDNQENSVNMVKEEDPLLEPLNEFEDADHNVELNHLFLLKHLTFEDDMVMYFEDDSSFIPKKTSLQFKSNDSLSGSLPFKEYVRFVNSRNNYFFIYK